MSHSGKRLWWGYLALVVFVMTISTVKADEVMPRYSVTKYVEATLDISGGRATASGAVCPYDFRPSEVTVRLQQYIEGNWRTIGVWTNSNTGGISEAGGSEEIDQGYEYRTYTYAKVLSTDGTVLEAVSKYSRSHTY